MVERAKSKSRGKKKTIRLLVILGAAGLVCYFLPPFRVVSLDEARARREQATFQPKEFAKMFWMGDLRKALDRATPADELLTLIRTDRVTAKKEYGRTAELGHIYYYFVRGIGRVVEINKDHVSVKLENTGQPTKADVDVVTAKIFGNAVRNATGLLDVNRFANSQDFNKLSDELNLLVESDVLAPFTRAVSVGAKVTLVGCAEIENEDHDLDPLRIIPVYLQIQDASDSGGVDR
jgi:predicted lipoprotein